MPVFRDGIQAAQDGRIDIAAGEHHHDSSREPLTLLSGGASGYFP
ncbi:MAG: hypothetical protein AW10_02720 [Candidatus Accumulibacter appositus]|uniref:Uncharacterized protein n=1 Tax=Candidatus Accumulibacter appositus TaxID=1454003 RepID=A0A011N8I7_9PROT|nr:MAG: hypothetical protein AW10_02720 [Candidatus Accumulibacter appositus]